METKENRSTFLNEAINQMYGMIRDPKSEKELREDLTYLFTDKIKESFKNGLEVGSRQKRQDSGNRKPYRKFRR
jgi:hypothetical protein